MKILLILIFLYVYTLEIQNMLLLGLYKKPT